jgi:thiosulfate/3-mercaptopyruvate sulfurtransferase
MKPLISAAELLALYQNNHRFVLVDARAGADTIREQYEAQHLKGALFVSLEDELSEKSDNAANGGRHPLPSAERFASLLGRLGITPDSHVIVYDDKNGANAASRFWWMMKAIGHENVQVVNGGLQAAVAAGVPVNADSVTPAQPSTYTAHKWLLPMKNIDEVASAALDAAHIVVDVRDHERYLGNHEPIDLVAGHIPGAVNIPFAENLDANGLYRSPEELRAKYAEAFATVPPTNVIVHCGSGVTACHTLLAMAHAGLEIPALYVGSWSEWSRNPREIATGENIPNKF